MSLESKIFKPGKNGKMKLVETVAHEEITKATTNRRLFNVHPGKKEKNKPREKKIRNEL